MPSVARHTMVLLALLQLVVSQNTMLGCFASIPSSYTTGDTFPFQSSGHCQSVCAAANAQFFAVTNGQQCFCGNTPPSGSPGTCTTPCSGFPQEMCGGSQSYNVYQIGNAVIVPSSSDSSSSTSTDVPSTSSSTTTMSTAPAPAPPTTTAPPLSGVETLTTNGVVVVFSTHFSTQGGSTVIVTKSATQSVTPTATPTVSPDSGKKKKSIVGPVVGGVVGGVVGLLLIVLGIFFFLRRHNKHKNEENIEKAYQEAIKPVAYDSDPFTDLNRTSSNIPEVSVPQMEGPGIGRSGSVMDYNRFENLKIVNPDE